MYCRAYNSVWFVDRALQFDCTIERMLDDIVRVHRTWEYRRSFDLIWKYHGVFSPRRKPRKEIHLLFG